MNKLSHLPINQATQFIADVFISNGVPPLDAKTVAYLMVQSDLAGADGHGIFRLPAYLKRIKAGGINLHPHIRVERERGGTALINGDNGLGHLVMNQVVELAIKKSHEHGVCWIGSHHGNHSGAASVYVRMLAERGLVGIYMAVGNANHMAPWGGTDLLLSTNPIAIAVPNFCQPQLAFKPFFPEVARKLVMYKWLLLSKLACPHIKSILCIWLVIQKRFSMPLIGQLRIFSKDLF
jgi:L-2-hydroxycarboxylate dehydrogenase (NAD+)